MYDREEVFVVTVGHKHVALGLYYSVEVFVMTDLFVPLAVHQC